MTGHADGSGETGNLHIRNQQIREYCITNDKVLFDFYDIECYDPDGNYYGNKLVDDACNYDSDGNGSRDSNWAIDWQESHTVGTDWYNCSSAHSQALNANRKAYAAWWLWARLAGWGQCTQAPDNTTSFADADLQQITVQWTDFSSDEDTFIIQRQVNAGAWDLLYDTMTADQTLYHDTGLTIGSYTYQIVATNSHGASLASNSASTDIVQSVPVDPTGLSATVSGFDINLAWADNSDNEMSGQWIQQTREPICCYIR